MREYIQSWLSLAREGGHFNPKPSLNIEEKSQQVVKFIDPQEYLNAWLMDSQDLAPPKRSKSLSFKKKNNARFSSKFKSFKKEQKIESKIQNILD